MTQTPEDKYDEQREDYLSLADEMNDVGVPEWDENDWDASAVANAKKYAKEHGLSWPPVTGDFDRWYDREHNPS